MASEVDTSAEAVATSQRCLQMMHDAFQPGAVEREACRIAKEKLGALAAERDAAIHGRTLVMDMGAFTIEELKKQVVVLTSERDAALTALRAREAEVRFAAGYISATAAFSGQHPEEVLRWIQKESAALATPAPEAK